MLESDPLLVPTGWEIVEPLGVGPWNTKGKLRDDALEMGFGIQLNPLSLCFPGSHGTEERFPHHMTPSENSASPEVQR